MLSALMLAQDNERYRRPTMARENTRDMMKDMDRLFDSFFYNDRRFPPVDIYEEKDSYVIDASLPGYDEESLSLFVEDHVLHMKADATREEEKGRKYLTRERRSQAFERSFTLPEDADEERLDASYRHGILSIRIAKKAKEEPRKIEVKIN